MQPDLLRWYHRELGFLRRMGEEFARNHPKIAGRLKLGPESSQDPHVERLIEAVAFMNARTRQKIDDDFPELSDAVLEVLQPQFLAPIPSMMVTQFQMSDKEIAANTGYQVAAGTAIETEAIEGEPCRFRTGYPVTLWPVEVKTADCASRPFVAPMTARSERASSMIHLSFRTSSPEVQFQQIDWQQLRIYLRGEPQLAFRLYEALFNNVIEIAFARSPRDPQPIVLSSNILKPVGLNEAELLLPGSERAAWEYRLLTEFFMFPEKFLFFDLTQLERLKESGFTDQCHVYFYLDRTFPELENNITAGSFQLGCTPVINLFKQRADPIYLSQTEYEYPVIGDIRRPDAVEIYSIDRVSAQTDDGEEVDFQPFYSINHLGDRQRKTPCYWHTSRRDSRLSDTDTTSGSDVFMSFVDLSFSTLEREGWVVDLETTCLNRDLPEKLPYGGGQPKLFVSEEAGAIGRVRALTAPTSTIRPLAHNRARWKLISQLSLNHLSLVGEELAAEALREILALYDFTESDSTRDLIQSLIRIESRRVTRRVSEQTYVGICRGVEVTLTFDNERSDDPKLFLLAMVLERFLGQACTINSFSQLVVQLDKEDRLLKKWPPRAGDITLL